MKIINCYYSKGSMINPEDKTKTISWDKVVFEGLTPNLKQFENSIFGGKFEVVKVNRPDLERIYQGDLKQLEGHNVEFYFNSSKQLVQVSVLDKKA